MDTSRTFFFWQGPFFFSGLTAGPTYRPLVQHSNPDTPLNMSKITFEVSQEISDDKSPKMGDIEILITQNKKN
jgi:hypothetical protein